MGLQYHNKSISYIQMLAQCSLETCIKAEAAIIKATNERRHYKVTPSLIGWAQK